MGLDSTDRSAPDVRTRYDDRDRVAFPGATVCIAGATGSSDLVKLAIGRA
jgi:hypothetical protein